MEKIKIDSKGCCNPFNDHNRVKFSDIRNVNDLLIEKAKDIGLNLLINQKICQACILKINRKPTLKPKQKTTAHSYNLRRETAAASNSMEVSDSEETEQTINPSPEFIEVDIPLIKSKLNELLPLLGLQTLDESKIRNNAYLMDVLNNFIGALVKHIFKGATVDKADVEMINQLKDKFNGTKNYQDKLKILSVLPKSWPAFRIQKEFNVSYFFANKTKNLVEHQGILCNMAKKIGPTKLNEETAKKVQEFYRCDDISRVCPGKRDYVRYNENMEKITIQRRLVLMNLNEAYQLFKEEFPNEKIGFSKFASIRPPECTLALETYGTHTTCVCLYHQNVKLITDSLQRNGFSPAIKNFHYWLDIMLCENKTNKCHMNECLTCPGKPAVEIYLHQQFQLQSIEQLTFKQWVNNSGRFYISV